VDPKLRDAVERQAVKVAKAYYVDELHGTDYEEVGKPYDIRVTVNGIPRRCEVKGSSMQIDTVELTCNEVEHGNAFTPVDLIVVDSIVPTRDPVTGEVTGATAGGEGSGSTGRQPSRTCRPPGTPTCSRPARSPECTVAAAPCASRHKDR
jgi:Protein NO VEIN, C-terminal